MITYTIEVNGQTAEHDTYPGKEWSAIAERAESRGGIVATLTRQTQLKRNAMTETISTAMVLSDCVICKPYVMAKVAS